MLRALSIRDVVLIDRLELAFDGGLSVLTGETGAGKSILLDSLGLALGERAEARLVRSGADQASVTAEFELPEGHPANAILAESDIAAEDGALLLRRVLGADGRSRAFVNDQSVSVTLLRRIGETLVEIHGQFENQRLLDPATHRDLLDAYGGLGPKVSGVAAALRFWRAARGTREAAEAQLDAARRDEDFLRHALDELNALDPRPGEEAELADRRALLMHGEKLADAMRLASDELSQGRGVEGALQAALRHLERVAEKADGRLDAAKAALERAAVEAAEGMAELDRAQASMDLDPAVLEQAEERLFALRACARKHDADVDGLARLRDDFAARLAAVEDGGANLDALRREEAEARDNYVKAAEALGAARKKAARKLDKAVAAELAPLKLDKATFVTTLESLDEADWGEFGCDRAVFQVATNPGAPAGSLSKIASGGELARFMLALKVVLSRADPVPVMVFDEVDAGVGGAVADAVGERLSRLAAGFQVLVVTHSPQVAARGANHWMVSKGEKGQAVATTVTPLGEGERREEIARMLAAAEVTDEARAAADSLLRGGGA